MESHRYAAVATLSVPKAPIPGPLEWETALTVIFSSGRRPDVELANSGRVCLRQVSADDEPSAVHRSRGENN